MAEITLEKLQEQITNNPELSQIIDTALGDVTPELKQQVFTFLVQCKIKPNDPLFVLMLSCRYFHLLSLDFPKKIENAMERGIVKLNGEVNEKTKAITNDIYSSAVASTEAEIAKSVNRLLEKQDKPTKKKRWLNSVKSALLVLIPLLTGILITQKFYEEKQLASLKLENAELLRWAKSNQGQFAKNLLTWNPGLFNGRCEQAVANLGIGYGETIRKNGENVGMREVKNGYCVVWRKPPNF